ncbi:MAG: hypothetical protein VB050_04565 [Geobacteraceae bacterium]|nr:hypothetical protein [Geobacteraceae bacterium]
MKNLIIAAWLAVVICLPVSTARAADWTNGTFSCDLTVVETSHWPLTWGTWKKINLKFSKYGKPYVAYECSENGSLFVCQHQNDNDREYWRVLKEYGDIRIRPGISKGLACEWAFDALSRNGR